MLTSDLRRVLDSAAIAHLATVSADGAPHVAPVFVGTEGDRVVVFTGPDSKKSRNLHRDPRVALSVATADDPFTPVVVRGRVIEWIDGDEAWEIVDRVAGKYIPVPYPRDDARVVAVIEPEVQRVGMG
ncbi:TIGR03618 family F420-dependent PPOX class oxidoreductase [Gordonia neofelifaecis]|uniref:Pyridoxamine 5'-phosphate oxidase N-terminal domain-containing protein n=1 Tax=Gordonia neofelifaecis NRRL B-59395 TaxID=644548 RepID=F1YDY2_9ACTN|nr:TIGR03618 family F420-dependent PPOX class oxidoreductase [Gordonia neofelifaecis]EGD57072.1 hypothetical protein SCNU_01810 [Gordonia neofelifaecis NRRL B-59395]